MFRARSAMTKTTAGVVSSGAALFCHLWLESKRDPAKLNNKHISSPTLCQSVSSTTFYRADLNVVVSSVALRKLETPSGTKLYPLTIQISARLSSANLTLHKHLHMLLTSGQISDIRAWKRHLLAVTSLGSANTWSHLISNKKPDWPSQIESAWTSLLIFANIDKIGKPERTEQEICVL